MVRRLPDLSVAGPDLHAGRPSGLAVPGLLRAAAARREKRGVTRGLVEASRPLLRTDLAELIAAQGRHLKTPPGIDAARLLGALALVESSGGHDRAPRFEPAYGPDGRYFAHSDLVKRLYRDFGAHAACSYSSWQILYVTAVELGYAGVPGCLFEDGSALGLCNDQVALGMVMRYIEARAFGRGALAVSAVADAYNSGNHLDDNRPEPYIAKVSAAYQTLEHFQWT